MDLSNENIILPRALRQHSSFRGGFTRPLLGNQSFYRDNIDREETENNRRRLADFLGIEVENIATPRLVHSSTVLAVGKEARGEGALGPETELGEADGLVTEKEEVFLLTTAADCLPLLFLHPQKLICASVHAGRRGIVGGILTEALEVMKSKFDCPPGEILGAIGPAIGECCYEVDSETADTFARATSSEFVNEKGDSVYLDLVGGARRQLLEGGMDDLNLEVLDHCTYCHPSQYFSARRQGQENFRTHAAIIGIKKS